MLTTSTVEYKNPTRTKALHHLPSRIWTMTRVEYAYYPIHSANLLDGQEPSPIERVIVAVWPYCRKKIHVIMGVGNLLVTCGTFQIGSLAGNPMSSNKVFSPYPIPRKVDGIGTSIRRDSIDHREFLQWRNYVWDKSTNIPRLLRSFWGGWTLCTACNYWECWPVAPRV